MSTMHLGYNRCMHKFRHTLPKPRIDHLEQMVPYIFALGCARAWMTLIFAAPRVNLDLGFDPHIVFDYSYVVTGVAIALLARRLSPLQEQPWSKLVAAGGMIAASLCIITSTISNEYASTLSIVGALLGGISFCVFLLLNSETLFPLSIVRILLYLAASRFLAVPIVFFCEGMDDIRFMLALIILPLIATTCVAFSYNNTPVAERPPRVYPRFVFPWKPLALFAVFSFAYGMREQQIAFGGGIHSSISTAVIMGIVFIAVYFFSDKFSFSALYRSPVFLLACGLLLIPAEGLLGTYVSGYLISMSVTLMSLLISLVFYDLAKRMGIAIIALMGMERIDKLFIVWGNDCADILSAVSPSHLVQEIITLVLILTLILACALLLYKNGWIDWGGHLVDSADLTAEAMHEEKLLIRCDEISKQCRLTPREDEILRLLARGKTYPEIEKELFIASGTLKAHTHHIYTKTGVSGKKELAALFKTQEPEAE